MSFARRVYRFSGTLIAFVCVLAGIAASISMGQALSKAVNTAYAAQQIAQVESDD